MKAKTLVKTVRFEERREGGILYEYTLSVEESRRMASYGLSLYSVRVDMTDEGERTTAELNSVFSSSERAFRFFDRIVDNLVTPIDLPYVYEDEIL